MTERKKPFYLFYRKSIIYRNYKLYNHTDNCRLTTTETDNIFQPSDIDNKYVRKPYFPAEGTVEEGLNQRLEMQYMTDDDKLDHEENEVIEEDSDILTQMSVTSSHEYSNFLINPYWLQDERMRKGEVDFLPNHEEEFWKSLIAKYLRPIENDEESQASFEF